MSCHYKKDGIKTAWAIAKRRTHFNFIQNSRAVKRGLYTDDGKCTAKRQMKKAGKALLPQAKIIYILRNKQIFESLIRDCTGSRMMGF